MNIEQKDWFTASGSLVIDDGNRLWRIIGFIDKPTVILDPVKTEGSAYQQRDDRQRQYEVMGSETSKAFHLLVRADSAAKDPTQ